MTLTSALTIQMSDKYQTRSNKQTIFETF